MFGFFKIQFLVDIVSFILKNISYIVGNYGVAIILTTVIVRLLMLPLTLKQEQSMKRMKELQPKIDELNKKYANDKAMLNQKTVELYKEEKVNPAGGCLPVIIQLPIFIALYTAFRDGNIVPDTATFLWFKLSAPDALFTLFGFTFNALPILTAVVTLVQQKMMQPVSTGDDSTANSMQSMLVMMPIMLLFIFYKQPAGLNLYYFINSTLSIAQQTYVMKRREA